MSLSTSRSNPSGRIETTRENEYDVDRWCEIMVVEASFLLGTIHTRPSAECPVVDSKLILSTIRSG